MQSFLRQRNLFKQGIVTSHLSAMIVCLLLSRPNFKFLQPLPTKIRPRRSQMMEMWNHSWRKPMRKTKFLFMRRMKRTRIYRLDPLLTTSRDENNSLRCAPLHIRKSAQWGSLLKSLSWLLQICPSILHKILLHVQERVHILHLNRCTLHLQVLIPLQAVMKMYHTWQHHTKLSCLPQKPQTAMKMSKWSPHDKERNRQIIYFTAAFRLPMCALHNILHPNRQSGMRMMCPMLRHLFMPKWQLLLRDERAVRE
mmetsp:Transcript_10456/g.38893  ORF Transcript_10456/g.38893 Transcript_10456/m.38893 type:complete len:253 (+) Transcript_10456:958-1716(+)